MRGFAYGCLKVYHSEVGGGNQWLDGIEIARVVVAFARPGCFELSLVLHGISHKDQVGLIVAKDERGKRGEEREQPCRKHRLIAIFSRLQGVEHQ